MLDRRTFLASTTAFGALAFAGIEGAIAQTAQPAAPANPRDAALDRMLQSWFDEDIRENPTFATALGLDTGAMAGLRGQLGDNSQARIEADRAKNLRRHQELTAFGRSGLSPAGELSYDIAEFRGETAAMATRFPYGGTGGRPAPYVVSQLGGTYYNLPDFLDTQHPVRTAQDADHYMSRLDQIARSLDNETERVRRDAALGVTPPDFVLDKAIGNLQQLRAQAPAQTTLVASIVRRTRAANIAGDWEARATRIFTGPIAAALDRQIAALQALRPNAVHDAGCWRLPQGEAYYNLGIRSNTTTAMTGEEIHRMGLEQVADLHRQLDPMLRSAGYTQGTVGERMNALNREPSQLYPNTDEGRAQLLRDLNGYIDLIAPLLPRVFNTIPRARLQINRVPPAIEAGAPGGYYQGAPLDNSRPGTYYINLRDTAEWPKYGLKTLTWHEGNPGHHFQGSIAREQGSLPLYRRAGGGFSAYSEGWALYSERVADELGVYEGDPLGRIGYLQAYLFRAVRLVVDSGIHHRRWSREQAVRYMVDNAAEPETSAVREIERYAVWPGQACAYKIGQTMIQRLRDDAQRRMGRRFDIKAFHDQMLLSGGMPLSVLERRIRSWSGA
jgi:uncharacterized protein (DUF885 family)